MHIATAAHHLYRALRNTIFGCCLFTPIHLYFAAYVNGMRKMEEKGCIKSHALIAGLDGEQDFYAGMHPGSLIA